MSKITDANSSTEFPEGYVMFRFQRYLEQLEHEFKDQSLPVEIRKSYMLDFSQGRVTFSVVAEQQHLKVKERLEQIAKEAFGDWLKS